MITCENICLSVNRQTSENVNFDNNFYLQKLDIIIDKLVSDNIKNISFIDYGVLEFNQILKLIKLVNNRGIKIDFISNGNILLQNTDNDEIYKYIESVTLPLDSIDDTINSQAGLDDNHFQSINKLLIFLQEQNVKININTKVTKLNYDKIEELGEHLQTYNINIWRALEFVPITDKQKQIYSNIKIETVDFRSVRVAFMPYRRIKKLEFREEKHFEEYIFININGDIQILNNREFITIGNITSNTLMESLKSYTPKKNKKVYEKITAFIAYRNEEMRNKIVNEIKKLDYVSIVGTSEDGIDSYNKILKLKPEMLFAEYNLNTMNCLQLAEKTKEKLNIEMPVLNIIGDSIPKNEREELIRVGKYKFNIILGEQYCIKEISSVLKDYREFKQD